ncbi:hypothetical protein [Sorangium sp. So ce1151]|uniref:hypothetical protein n=1 Tax=Sorangium sp. So ce1151 TaxID=3133332 RepID=UPI003F60349E
MKASLRFGVCVVSAASMAGCVTAGDPGAGIDAVGEGALAATCPDVSGTNIQRSLVITDPTILSRFSFTRTMDRIRATAGIQASETSVGIFQRWMRTFGASPDPGDCDDPRIDQEGYGIACPRSPELKLASVNPFPDTAQVKFNPVGIFNRFDLTPASGATCGEYRIVYAMSSTNPVIISGRAFIIFEGVMPNPTPADGISGCLPVARFWQQLTADGSTSSRATKLERFFFTGGAVSGFPALVDAAHYGLANIGQSIPAGQIRTNFFVDFVEWHLREFKLRRRCTNNADPATCTLAFEHNVVRSNPAEELFAGTHAKSADFQAPFRGMIHGLAAGDVSDIRMGSVVVHTELLAAAGAVPARLLGLLSVAYGRLREDEITTALGAPIEGALAGIEPLVTAVDGTYAFRWNAARREVEERLDRSARETSIRRLLSLAPDGYPCAYARAHLEQATAPLRAFAALVTEEHLARWMARPEGYLGFVADLERVRRRSVETLASGHEAAALAVRAALVEASVNWCARREDEDNDAPVGVEPMTREAPLADKRQQTRALVALGAAVVAGPARDEVLARAEDAARRIPEAELRGEAFVALAEAAGDDRGYALAREALAAYRDAADPVLPQLLAVGVLPPDEGVAVAREVLARLRDGGGDAGDLDLFADRFPRAIAEALWPDAEALPGPARARALAALAEVLGDPDRARAAFAAVEQHAAPYDPLAHRTLARLVPLLAIPEARRAATLAPRFGERADELLEGLIPRLRAQGDPAEDLLEALPEASRVRALARSLPFATEPGSLWARIDEALRRAEPLDRYGLLFDVGPWLGAAVESEALLAWIAPLSDAHHLSALGFLARHDPAHAPELARRALPLALRLGADEPDRLLDLVPLARYFPPEGAAAVFGLLLDALAGDFRSAALAGDGVSLVRLVPLIAALAGDDGLAGAAREVVQVAAWFP